MLSRVENLWHLALATFPKSPNGFYSFNEENFANLKKEMDAMSSVDVRLEETLRERQDLLESRTGHNLFGVKSNAPVTFVDVYSGPSFSIGIFVLHKGSHMPIHDHPYMHGILKVLSGEVKLDSYTIVREEACQNHGITLVAEKTTYNVSASDPACVLTPTVSNLHALSPVGGSAAFMDILSPPYYSSFSNVRPNPCNFYTECSQAPSEDPARVYVRLLRNRSQSDYWCDTALYRGPELPDDKCRLKH